MLVRAPTAARPASRGWPAWARAASAAVALHAWLLWDGSVEVGRSGVLQEPRETRGPAGMVRTLELARPMRAQAPSSELPTAASVAVPLSPVRAPAHAPARAPDASPTRLLADTTTPRATTILPMQTPASADDTDMARPDSDEGTPPPVYRTRLPPAFVWHYAVQRGARSGLSELRFARDGGGYQIEWSSRWPGREELGLASRGGIDESGLAPERFADRRRGRERQAANFDRTGGRITYSGPPVEHALLAGAQDRVSWMVQLPAIIDADPAAFAATGTTVQLQVSGARGDAGVWTFIVQGRDDLALPAGPVLDTLHLVREARRPYDTRVEVWLDAARHHLPVRVRLTPVPGGEPLELQLDAPPASVR